MSKKLSIMNINKNTITIVIVLLLVMTFDQISAQTYTPYPSGTITYNGYQFPIVPGTDSWKSLSYEQRLENCQLPDDTIQAISTVRLLETCLYFPYNIDILCFDNALIGFDAIKQVFNGYEALFNRTDLVTEAQNFYKDRQASFITNISESYERGLYSFDYIILELILLQVSDLNHTSENELYKLVESIVRKVEISANMKKYYSKVYKPLTYLLLGRIMKNLGLLSIQEGSSMEKFLSDGIVRNYLDLDIIINQAKEVIQ